MGYLIFRGSSTASLAGIEVLEMPSHKKAAKRMTEYSIKGRDGILHTDDGFDNFDITARIILIDAPATARQVVNAWADGFGKLVTSDNLTLAYKALVKDEIEWYRDVASAFIETFSSTKQYYSGNFCIYSGQIYKFTASHKGQWNAGDVALQSWLVKGVYDVADITFNCYPHMYEAVDSTMSLIAGQGTIVSGGSEMFPIVNPGTDVAMPDIKVYGIDTVAFDFCGEYIIINGMEANNPVNIDCENGYIYADDGSGKSIVGSIPKIPLGSSGVYFNPEHSPTKIDVTPHWRWV